MNDKKAEDMMMEEWEDSRQREEAIQRYLKSLRNEDKKARWVKQEWSNQDILVSVNQRFSTHVPLEMITIAYGEGIVASHPAHGVGDVVEASEREPAGHGEEDAGTSSGTAGRAQGVGHHERHPGLHPGEGYDPAVPPEVRGTVATELVSEEGIGEGSKRVQGRERRDR